MVAGFDRYFQLARCMRDEDLRADRQPEFTQLDIEMSFIDEDDVFAALEHAIPSAWEACDFRGGRLAVPFPRMTWRHAMDRYGVDKPDTRFDLLLRDLTGHRRDVRIPGLRRGGRDRRHRQGHLRQGRRRPQPRATSRDTLTEVARGAKARGLAYLWKRADGWQGGIAKFFTTEELEAIGAATGAEIGDCILMVADRPGVVNSALGRRAQPPRARATPVRRRAHRHALGDRVSDVRTQRRDRRGRAAHHPFTMIHADDLDLLESDPLAVRSRAYDLVVNGREIGSGSIRITDPAIQQRVLAALGIDAEEARRKFGFLLEAFEYGVPPHGGWAGGIDRMIMEGLGTDNIRDVIAFPKNQQAQEPMTDAPAPVEPAQLRELGIAHHPEQPHAVSPGLGLAILFVLIGTTLSSLVRPRRGSFLLALVLAAAGVVAGELVAIATRVGGPPLGALHPVADAVGVVLFEVTGAVLAPARRRGP